MVAGARYDHIGRGYSKGRRPDRRLERALIEALGSASTVLNVGAGTGNYEPTDRALVALEPSKVMIDQRGPGSAPAVRGFAEALPFASRSFDATLAISTVHHWSDVEAGLAEMARVAPRRVVYFSEPSRPGMHWLVDDYFPVMLTMTINVVAPSVERVVEGLGGGCDVRVFEVPHDFAESSGGAYWNRPEAFVDPAIRQAMSMFTLLDPSVVEDGLARLRRDLESDAWDARHGHLRPLSSFDMGYRIVISDEP